MNPAHRQLGASARFEWGPAGAITLGGSTISVVVDVFVLHHGIVGCFGSRNRGCCRIGRPFVRPPSTRPLTTRRWLGCAVNSRRAQ